MKRKKGEGMVRLRSDGMWEARIIQNKRQKSFYGHSEQEAHNKLLTYINMLTQGLKINKNISYAGLLHTWMARKKQEIKPQSFHRLVSTVTLHILPAIGHIDILHISAQLIADAVIQPKAKILSYSSVKKIYDALNESLRYAHITGHITRNPMDLVVMPAQTSEMFILKKAARCSSLEILSDDEIRRFVAAAHATYNNGTPVFKNGPLFILMLNTGLRIGEATALCWQDYDAREQTLTIGASIIQTKNEAGKCVIAKQDSVKTRNSKRILKLNQNAITALPHPQKAGYIFCTKDGRPLHPRHVQVMLDSILRRAEIPHKSTHVFRHTFASRLFEKGVDVRIVSELLGHTNVSTTYNTYITLNKKQKARAMIAIEDMY